MIVPSLNNNSTVLTLYISQYTFDNYGMLPIHFRAGSLAVISKIQRAIGGRFRKAKLHANPVAKSARLQTRF